MMRVRLIVLLIVAAAALYPTSALAMTIDGEIDKIQRQNGAIVYALDDDPDRAAALRYIQGIKQQFFPAADLIDAYRIPPASLVRKLKHGFVLYGVLRPGRSLAREILEATFGKVQLSDTGLETRM